MNLLRPVPWICLALSAGCGGIATDLGDASTDAATGKDSAPPLDGSITPTDAGTAGCPTSLPSNAASCSLEGIDCEYGSDARVECNAVASCRQGSWEVTSGADCAESQPGQNGCPLDRASIQVGSACSTEAVCDYDGGVCACGFGGHPPSEQWVCDGPPQDPACPYPRPKLGTPCNSVAQISCSYGPCSALGGSAQICTNGTWHLETIPCPP